MKTKALTVLMILTAALALQTGCHSMSTERLKNSIEVLDVETSWVSKFYQPWPPRLILVPKLTFRIKNIGNKPLNYINFNAVFSIKGETENLGDGYMAAIRGTSVLPGQISPVITLVSNFGFEGKTRKHIEENPAWRPVEVRLFAQSHGSQFALLGVFDVSRNIEFKEPEQPQPAKATPAVK